MFKLKEYYLNSSLKKLFINTLKSIGIIVLCLVFLYLFAEKDNLNIGVFFGVLFYIFILVSVINLLMVLIKFYNSYFLKKIDLSKLKKQKELRELNIITEDEYNNILFEFKEKYK